MNRNNNPRFASIAKGATIFALAACVGCLPTLNRGDRRNPAPTPLAQQPGTSTVIYTLKPITSETNPRTGCGVRARLRIEVGVIRMPLAA